MTINQKWRANYSGLSCQCRIVGNEKHVQVIYPRCTRLGQRIARGAPDIVRPVLANYLRQELGLPRGEDTATVVTFTGV